MRALGVPKSMPDTQGAQKQAAWIAEHALPEPDVLAVEREVATRGDLLRTLSYGPSVYDYHGLSVCVATCMTETQSPDEIRSLILMPDGHVYHSWFHPGSVLL